MVDGGRTSLIVARAPVVGGVLFLDDALAVPE